MESIITLMVIFTAALASPGPDFALIVKNSLTFSKKTAILTALGIALGALVHTIYILIGVGEFLINNELYLTIFTYIGASYLIYIGCKAMMAKAQNIAVIDASHKKDIAPSEAIYSGFLTCLLNPKAVLFLTSMFTAIIEPNTQVMLLVIYGGIIFSQTFLWYSMVALFLSSEAIQTKVGKIEHWINRVTGLILFSIGGMLIYEQLVLLN